MMTLKNMREQGVRHISLWCTIECGHHVDILVDDLPEDTLAPEIGRRYRCSRCGRHGVESRPAWHLRDGKPFGTL